MHELQGTSSVLVTCGVSMASGSLVFTAPPPRQDEMVRKLKRMTPEQRAQLLEIAKGLCEPTL